MPEQRRHPILVTFLYQALIDSTDEALDLFDRRLAEADHRASRDLEGVLRKKQEGELMNKAACLNLVTNAVVIWNTVYMAVAIEQLRAEGRPVNEEDIARLSPARDEHIGPHRRLAG